MLPTSPDTRPLDRWIFAILALFAFVIPIVWVPGAFDSFRLPKQALLETEGFLLLAVTAFGARWMAFRQLPRERRGPLWLAGAAVAWTLVGTIFSTQRALSLLSLAFVTTAAIVFCWTYVEGRQWKLWTLSLVIVPAILNSIVVILQARQLWTPFEFPADLPQRLRTAALLGNPDDAGSFLVGPFLACVVLAMTTRGVRRAAGAAAAAVTLGGLVATHTVTPLIAIAAGVAAIIPLLPRRSAIAAATLAVIGAVIVLTAPPVRHRIQQMRDAMVTGHYNAVLSNRLTPTFAAENMIRRRPLLGVGPGCFALHYFDNKVAAEQQHPALLTNNPLNYGEAHNDHIQLLAEGGPIAYAIFLAAALVLAAQSFVPRERAVTPEQRFARLFALPFTVGFAVLMLAHFPLHLGATVSVMLFLAALTAAWGERTHA